MSRRGLGWCALAAIIGLAWRAHAATTSIFPSGVWIPAYSTIGTSYGTETVDAAGEGSGCAFIVPKTGSITKVGFRTGSVTTPQSLDVGLQTLTASGLPSGTMYGGSSSGTVASPLANSGYTVTLGTPATATLGDHVASLVMFTSAIGNLQIAKSQNSVAPGGMNYNLRSVGSGWQMQTTYGCVSWYEYSDGSYSLVPGVFASSNITTTNYANSSTPDERALKFKLPFTFSISQVAIGMGTLGANFSIVLYDSDGTTALDTVNISTNNALAVASAWTTIPLTSSHTMTANTFYYVSVKPTTTTNFGGLTRATYPSNASMDQDYGGKNFYESTRTDAGAWTDATGVRPWISVLVDNIQTSGGGVKSTFIFD